MSTRFTEIEQNFQLGQSIIHRQNWMTSSLLNLMAKLGHEELTAAHLQFMNYLDCGDTHPSAIARRIGVSRQAVYRSTRELQKLGVLEMLTDPQNGNQKIIHMTEYGNRVALDARKALDDIEMELSKRLGQDDFAALKRLLSADWGAILSEKT